MAEREDFCFGGVIMTADKTYKNWKAVTEADFVSLFIKTWFAYISTLRIMYPEAYNRRGDKKYLNKYKDFYRTEGYRRFNVDKMLWLLLKKFIRRDEMLS